MEDLIKSYGVEEMLVPAEPMSAEEAQKDALEVERITDELNASFKKHTQEMQAYLARSYAAASTRCITF